MLAATPLLWGHMHGCPGGRALDGQLTVMNTMVVQAGRAHGISRPRGTEPGGAKGAAAHVPSFL